MDGARRRPEKKTNKIPEGQILERETGIEPATFSLATRRSTIELLPLYRFAPQCKLFPNFSFFSRPLFNSSFSLTAVFRVLRFSYFSIHTEKPRTLKCRGPDLHWLPQLFQSCALLHELSRLMKLL